MDAKQARAISLKKSGGPEWMRDIQKAAENGQTFTQIQVAWNIAEEVCNYLQELGYTVRQISDEEINVWW